MFKDLPLIREFLGFPVGIRRFLIKATLLLFLFETYFIFLETRHPILNEKLTILVGKNTADILNGIYSTDVFHIDAYPTYTKINLEEVPLKIYLLKIYHFPLLGIENTCNGFELIALYIGFLICIEGRISKKIFYITIGSILIHYANILRCWGLVELTLHDHNLFNFAHHYLYKILLYGFIFCLWLLYLRKNEI